LSRKFQVYLKLWFLIYISKYDFCGLKTINLPQFFSPFSLTFIFFEPHSTTEPDPLNLDWRVSSLINVHPWIKTNWDLLIKTHGFIQHIKSPILTWFLFLFFAANSTILWTLLPAPKQHPPHHRARHHHYSPDQRATNHPTPSPPRHTAACITSTAHARHQPAPSPRSRAMHTRSAHLSQGHQSCTTPTSTISSVPSPHVANPYATRFAHDFPPKHSFSFSFLVFFLVFLFIVLYCFVMLFVCLIWLLVIVLLWAFRPESVEEDEEELKKLWKFYGILWGF